MLFNVGEVCASLPPVVHLAIIIFVFVWEYTLGKTSFGSTIGLFIEHPIEYLVDKLMKDKNGPQSPH